MRLADPGFAAAVILNPSPRSGTSCVIVIHESGVCVGTWQPDGLTRTSTEKSPPAAGTPAPWKVPGCCASWTVKVAVPLEQVPGPA